jgi:hypothetical protein
MKDLTQKLHETSMRSPQDARSTLKNSIMRNRRRPHTR